ncbi:MAG: DNA replication and repair protein RecF [Bacteroidales bacterium]|nr:DNA replication and repair protein RecF [Bacteroidales bacterium]
MYLKQLLLTNFKNYSEANFIFSKKINCFIGNNGAGKTNILDAIYYLSFSKSYFNSIDSQNILHDKDFFTIHGTYLKNGDDIKDTISCTLKQEHKKQFKLNNNLYKRLADHIGLFPLIMISPYDRDLINNGSEVRRKYIDSVISQFNKNYLNNLINYNKALLQRNKLLKQFYEQNYFDISLLEIWDKQLFDFGNAIHKKRKEFLNEFIPLFQEYYTFISGEKEKVDIVYISQLNDKNFEELLSENLYKDKILKYTTTGIHKDELLLKIQNYPIKKFGSQGQQKSFFIALKLAQFEHTKNIKGFKPILLFDDIFDKLDDLRVEKIINLVSNNNFGQVFITDTQKERIKKIFNSIEKEHKIFNIKSGKAEEIKL